MVDVQLFVGMVLNAFQQQMALQEKRKKEAKKEKVCLFSLVSEQYVEFDMHGSSLRCCCASGSAIWVRIEESFEARPRTMAASL